MPYVDLELMSDQSPDTQVWRCPYCGCSISTTIDINKRYDSTHRPCERCLEVDSILPRGVNFNLTEYIKDVATEAAKRVLNGGK